MLLTLLFHTYCIVKNHAFLVWKNTSQKSCMCKQILHLECMSHQIGLCQRCSWRVDIRWELFNQSNFPSIRYLVIAWFKTNLSPSVMRWCFSVYSFIKNIKKIHKRSFYTVHPSNWLIDLVTFINEFLTDPV